MKQFVIKSHADQEFSTIINGRRVTLRLWYSRITDRWSLDLSLDGDPVLQGRRVVTGVDMLEAFDFGIGVMFAVSERGDEPGRDQLPEGLVKFYHASESEVNAAVAS